MNTFESLLARALVVMNETKKKLNTANRVGSLLRDVLMFLQNAILGIILKGSLANSTAIQTISNPAKGDTYKATDTGHYWTYDGSAWNDIGEVIPNDVATQEDLQDYLLEKKTYADGSYDEWFHEEDGGGFESYDAPNDIISAESANRGGTTNNLLREEYVKNKTTNVGVRRIIGRLADGVLRLFYTKGNTSSFTGNDEIAVQGDLAQYNVTNKVPLSSGSYYTATTARAAVPTDIRKAGLIITFQIDANTWVTEQYANTNISQWTTATNWRHTEFIDLGRFSTITDLRAKLDSMTNNFGIFKLDASSNKNHILEVYYSGIKTVQVLRGTFALNNPINFEFISDYNELKRTYDGTAWSDWTLVNDTSIIENKIVQLESDAPIFNVTQQVPLQTGYYTAATARAAVPEDVRKVGLIVTYQTDSSTWVSEQYFQGVLSNWSNLANWKPFGSGEKINLKNLNLFDPLKVYTLRSGYTVTTWSGLVEIPNNSTIIQVGNWMFNGNYDTYRGEKLTAITNMLPGHPVKMYDSTKTLINSSTYLNQYGFCYPVDGTKFIEVAISNYTDSNPAINDPRNYVNAYVFAIDSFGSVLRTYSVLGSCLTRLDGSSNNFELHDKVNSIVNKRSINLIDSNLLQDGQAVFNGDIFISSDYIGNVCSPLISITAEVKLRIGYPLDYDYSNIVPLNVLILDKNLSTLASYQNAKDLHITTPENSRFILVGFGFYGAQDTNTVHGDFFREIVKKAIVAIDEEANIGSNIYTGENTTQGSYVSLNGSLNSTEWSANNFIGKSIPVTENSRYTLKQNSIAGNLPNGYNLIAFYTKSMQVISVLDIAKVGGGYVPVVNFTTPKYCKFISFNIAWGLTNDQISDLDLSDIELIPLSGMFNDPIYSHISHTPYAFDFQLERMKRELNDLTSKIFSGKKLLALGDSITASYHWLDYLLMISQFKNVYNYSLGMATLQWREIYSVCNKLDEAITAYNNSTIAAPDIIFIPAGINDVNVYNPGTVEAAWSGDLTDDIKSTTAGGLRYILTRIAETWIEADVYLILPYQIPYREDLYSSIGYYQKINNQINIIDIMKKSAILGGVKVIDMFSNSKFSALREQNRQGKYILAEGSDVFVHPSPEGGVEIARVVLNEYIRLNSIQPNILDYRFNV
ncbi:MAG: SGNH/GDSL hydrolase family protein [Candidatus Symbiothrix sp.]|jgi:hypothetical protein|nr:SGNH/GDSL hydrolase family protein [Candidatus Symbiothrix sp.]